MMLELDNLEFRRYLLRNPSSMDFFFRYLDPLVKDESSARVRYRKDSDDFELWINDIQWCKILKNSSIQILPYGKSRDKKIEHIANNLDIYDVHNFLKDKTKKNYYIGIQYKKVIHNDQALLKVLSESLNFIKSL